MTCAAFLFVRTQNSPATYCTYIENAPAEQLRSLQKTAPPGRLCVMPVRHVLTGMRPKAQPKAVERPWLCRTARPPSPSAATARTARTPRPLAPPHLGAVSHVTSGRTGGSSPMFGRRPAWCHDNSSGTCAGGARRPLTSISSGTPPPSRPCPARAAAPPRRPYGSGRRGAGRPCCMSGSAPRTPPPCTARR